MDAAVNLRDPVSIHARHATGDTPLGKSPPSSRRFQFTPVMRRATGWVHPRQPPGRFNSRPSCDGRRAAGRTDPRRDCFNSRPSCDGRPLQDVRALQRLLVSIHARHATGDPTEAGKDPEFAVSIHARHATGDVWASGLRSDGVFQFTPVMRRATECADAEVVEVAFQFTPVMRRATCEQPRGCLERGGFNSRPSCDGRPQRRGCEAVSVVSIHARHATGDSGGTHAFLAGSFQFTPFMRRATQR